MYDIMPYNMEVVSWP